MKEWWLLVREFFGISVEAGALLIQKFSKEIKRYKAFLGRASMVLGTAFGVFVALFVVGAVSEIRPIRGGSLFLMGLTAMAWMLAAFPVILVMRAGYEWGSAKKTFKLIGGVGLWFFFAAFYFSLVPVPGWLVLPMLLGFGLFAYFFVKFGVPEAGAKFVMARSGLALTILTILFVLTAAMPALPSGIGRLFTLANVKTDEAIDDITASLVQPIPYSSDLVFFNPDGRPLVWYHKTDAGGFELYKSIRRHPRYGTELQPVTEAVVRELERLELERARKKEEERIAAQKKQEEEEKLAELQKLLEKAEKAASSANNPSKVVRVQVPVPGPAGPQGVQGLPGQVGPQGTQGLQGQPGISPSLPEKRRVSIPAGTPLEVVLDQAVSTARNKVGDRVRMSLARSVSVDESVVFPVGTEFAGLVLQLERPGQVSGVAVLALTLANVSFEGNFVPVQTGTIRREGQGTKAKDVGKVAVTSGIGAVIGAIFGGKEGAAKGAAVGGGAATAQTLATRGEDLELKPETKLVFELARDLTLELQ